MFAIGQSGYNSYYKSGKLKISGQGFIEENKWKVSAESGLNLRESPDLRSKKIAKIPYGTFVSISSKTDINFTIIDTDKITGVKKSINGNWVKIGSSFYLNPGDQGYYEDLVEPSYVEGYLFDGFLKEEKYLVHKTGVWTYFYETGVIKEKVYFREGEAIKRITYDSEGKTTGIEESQPALAKRIKITFHKNGKIKFKEEADEFGDISVSFDINGNMKIITGNDINNDLVVLSEDIKDFYFTHFGSEKNIIEMEKKPIAKFTEFTNGRWLSTIDSLSGIDIYNGKWKIFYKGIDTGPLSIYDYNIKREFIQESGRLYKLLEYLIITNDTGTLEYNIIQYSKDLLSLSYVGRGNTLNYKPEK